MAKTPANIREARCEEHVTGETTHLPSSGQRQASRMAGPYHPGTARPQMLVQAAASGCPQAHPSPRPSQLPPLGAPTTQALMELHSFSHPGTAPETDAWPSSISRIFSGTPQPMPATDAPPGTTKGMTPFSSQASCTSLGIFNIRQCSMALR